MPSPLWIGFYPDGTLRPSSSTRRRAKLPAVPELREKLQAVGGPGFDKKVLSALGGGGSCDWGPARLVHSSAVPVVALVRINNVGSVHGNSPLSEWGGPSRLAQHLL